MPDQSRLTPAALPPPAPPSRRPVLLVALAGLACLAVLGLASRLTALEVGLASVPVLLVALLVLPRRADEPSTAPAVPAERVGDDGVPGFTETMIDPCLILDRRGVVLHANRLALAEFPGIAMGEPLAFALRQPALLAAVERARETGASQTVEIQAGKPATNWYAASVAPFTAPPAGAIAAPRSLYALNLRNLSEQRRLETLRVDFIANASHELRTPLASLLGFIDTLLGPAARDPEARERFLGLMRGQAERMSRLVDDLLSLSRIEMRQHVRPAGRVRLDALLREVAEGLQPQVDAAGLRLEFALPADAAMVTGDREELYEVIENLVDNALKYGAGGETVELSITPSALPGQAVMLTVIDHGQGVAAEHVPRLTERFYRVDAESSRRKKGTGLGLAIVKHIVTRHRGQLILRSAPGEGTRVEVHLPG